ncbi:MAG: ATP-dependent helicase [Oscillospiraceae bacterium]|nr:ATP-dependent helicase [Oscillospiraceae bacterium]
MEFERFDREFLSHLNPQQREAVLAVRGPVLILATPGSGKTTVLVTRLGYMTLCCGIDPRSILTMTYTRAATRDMRTRFSESFGEELAAQLQFRTINGISARIISYAGEKFGRSPFTLLDEGERGKLLREVWQRVCESYPEDSDLRDLGTAITYIKNMMLPESEIPALHSPVRKLSELFREYNTALRAKRVMDYDDQMLYALALLQKSPELLSSLQDRYRYYCVDEAQDSSRVQHEIIRLLASRHENLFMVGDEDQSIYGFRAAWPDALVNFSVEHPGAWILLIEENYRSTPEIIDASNRFVAKNRFRHRKTIVPTRGSGLPVRLIPVDTREAQIQWLLKEAPSWNRETAVLFRNNDSALPLIDRFEAMGLPYNCRNFEDVFFSHRVVSDILDIIRFASEQDSIELFLKLYYKLGAGISKKDALWAVSESRQSGKPPLIALRDSPELRDWSRDQVIRLPGQLRRLLHDRAETALSRIWETIRYGRYAEQCGLDSGKYYILRLLASGLPGTAALVEKLNRLRETVATHENRPENRIVLSTVHSSKGLEYDRVYLLDVIDGILPSRSYAACTDDGKKREYEEERRLFYVAMTRAKDELCVFLCKGQPGFAAELAEELPKPEKPVKPSLLSGRKKAAPGESPESFLARIRPGSQVTHRSFGTGTVLEIQGDLILVDFSGHGKRRLSISTGLRLGLLR